MSTFVHLLTRLLLCYKCKSRNRYTNVLNMYKNATQRQFVTISKIEYFFGYYHKKRFDREYTYVYQSRYIITLLVFLVSYYTCCNSHGVFSISYGDLIHITLHTKGPKANIILTAAFIYKIPINSFGVSETDRSETNEILHLHLENSNLFPNEKQALYRVYICLQRKVPITKDVWQQ